mgnify:CR=1 FL=1|tara:strand:- start:1349 stop:2170 length:822 start_codon:yes stop_codon:yes gene_type:complete
MRILFTGFNGFIGKNVTQKIIRKKNEVESMFFIEKDYMNYEFWQTSLDRSIIDCDVIVHMGAITDTMFKDCNEMLKYNFEFSKLLFDKASAYKKKVIYSSSAANTGTTGLPSNIYGWSKYVTEQYGMAKVEDFVALRYFNVYGPGEEHKGKMASVAHQAHLIMQKGMGKFMLFPNNAKRDFVYIRDVVDATIYPIFNRVPKGIYEVGSGEARSFEDVLNLMEIPYEYRDKKEIPDGYQSFTEANKSSFMEGWKPKYNLEKGIKAYKEYLNESL